MFYQLPIPRHPLMRLIAAVIGAFALVAILALGMFAFMALVAGAAVWWLVRSFWPARVTREPIPGHRPTNAPPGVIEGEFTVVKGPVPDRENPQRVSGER